MSWWEKAEVFVSGLFDDSARVRSEQKERDKKQYSQFKTDVKSGGKKLSAAVDSLVEKAEKNRRRVEERKRKREGTQRQPKTQPKMEGPIPPAQTGSTTPTGAPGMGPQGVSEDTALRQQPTTGVFAPVSEKQAKTRAETTASIQSFGRGVKEALDTPEERKRVATTAVAGIATGAVIAATPFLVIPAAALGVGYGIYKVYQTAKKPKEERAYFLGQSLVQDGAFIGGAFGGARAVSKGIGKKAAGALSRSKISEPGSALARSDKRGFVSGTSSFKIKYGDKDVKFAKKYKLPTSGKTEYSQILSGKEGKLDWAGFSTKTTATGPKRKFGLPKEYTSESAAISGSTPIASYGKREVRGFGDITKGGIKGRGFGGQRLDRPTKGQKFDIESRYGFGDIKITETARIKKSGMETDIFGPTGRKRTTVITEPSSVGFKIKIPGKRKTPSKGKDTDISISLGIKPSRGRTPSKGKGITQTQTKGKTRGQFSTTQITPRTRANLLKMKTTQITTSGFAYPSGLTETGESIFKQLQDKKTITDKIMKDKYDEIIIQKQIDIELGIPKTPTKTRLDPTPDIPGGYTFTPPTRPPPRKTGPPGVPFGGFGFGGGSRGSKFSGKAKYQTVASPTAVFFGIKRTAKQRKQKRFTGLEIIGITNGKRTKQGRRRFSIL